MTLSAMAPTLEQIDEHVHRGTVVDALEDGRFAVRAASGIEIVCEALTLGMQAPLIAPDDTVIVLSTATSPETGYILGRIARRAEPPLPRLITCTLERLEPGKAWVRLPEHGSLLPALVPHGWSSEVVEEMVRTGHILLGQVEVDASEWTVRLIGAIEQPGAEVLHLRARRIVIEADDQVDLRTRRSKISLLGNGEIRVLAKTIFSRARKLQKLLAPMLRLN